MAEWRVNWVTCRPEVRGGMMTGRNLYYCVLERLASDGEWEQVDTDVYRTSETLTTFSTPMLCIISRLCRRNGLTYRKGQIYGE